MRNGVSTKQKTTDALSSAQDWLTARDAVDYLKMSSRKALYQAVQRGQVPVHRLGKRRLRFNRAELYRLMVRDDS